MTAGSRYGVHSPFVYEFATQVLPHQESEVGDRIEPLRQEALHSETVLRIRDWGAGYSGKHEPVVHKQIREVARSSSRKRRSGEFLYRLCKWLQPEFGLELGGNLGFSTAYQVSGIEKGHFTSIEGSASLAAEASKLWRKLGLEIDSLVGEFDQELAPLLDKGASLDYVLLDGNHSYEATLSYFNRLFPLLRPNGVIVVDDIHWSEGMQQAWQEIRKREDVSLSIDLYFMGLCFFRPHQAKENFRFRYWGMP